ncbi:MAG: TIGR02594 family protein [Candidatus Binatia bacterium]
MLGKNEGRDHAALTDYLKTGGVNLDPQKLAWCAAFVNSTMQQSGMQGTGSNMAKSFMNWGQATNEPKEGDIAVFHRGDPKAPTGHVGFFKGVNPDGSIQILGGNQGGAAEQGGGVTLTSMPASSLVGYRTAGAPAAPATPAEPIEGVAELGAALRPQVPTAAQQQVSAIQPSGLMNDPATQANPQQAQQILSSLIADRRKKMGMGVNLMG